jgi:hypothetical protein
MSKIGKEKIVQKIAKAVINVGCKQSRELISLYWKTEQMVRGKLESRDGMPNTQEDLKEIIVNGKVAESDEVTCEKVNGEVAASNEVTCVNGEVEAYKKVTSEKVNGEGEEINEVTCEKINEEVAVSNEVTCGESVREVEERTQDSVKSGTQENLLNLVNSSIAEMRVST